MLRIQHETVEPDDPQSRPLLHVKQSNRKIRMMSSRIRIVTALLIPALWCLPVVTGYLSSVEPDRVFLGWMRSDDFHRYGSFIEQTARLQRVLYMDYSTVEHQSPRMIALYFTVLGWIKRLTGCAAQDLWLWSRLAVGAVFILTLYRILSVNLKPDNTRIVTTFLLILTSCGWEWLTRPSGIQLPRWNNFWMDGFSTFNSFHNPLKIAGIALGLMFFQLHLQYERKGTARSWLPCALMFLILWGVHPNSAVPVYCGLVVLAALPAGRAAPAGLRRRWLRILPYFAPAAVVMAYIVWMNTDPMTSHIIRQYRIPFSSEPLRTYIFRYGFILPFGIWGIFSAIWRRNPFEYLMIGWLGGAVFFSLYPYMTGLLYQHMVHLPLAFFAAEPLSAIFKKTGSVSRLGLIGLLAGTFLMGDAAVLIQASRQTREDVWPTSLYASRFELNAMDFLRDLPQGNVLVNRDTGNKIGWLSLKNVFLGHWGTTPDKGRKTRELRMFYDRGTTPSDRIKILNRYRILYIWYGPREKDLGPLDAALPLELIYRNRDVDLYRIQAPMEH
ncbi:hypothetical protein JXA40_06655 [bacterium]|nr:hypothetical protein [candidate division CSSED10-310 bacterium]